MVKIAVAGGLGELAREVLDALVETGKHDITILSRKDVPFGYSLPRVTCTVVNYANKESLAQALRGVHTVLSFINQKVPDQNESSQKSLINACIIAGVNRFAPCEYGCNDISDLPFWVEKLQIRAYLEKVNEKETILEYTLFQPGVFMDYLASPNQTSKYITPLETFFDFQNRRAIVVEGHEDAVMTYTSVKDIAGMVASAVELEDGQWPKIGGINGNRVTVSQLLDIGERVRGRPFDVEKVKLDDLQAGNMTSSWTLGKRHPSFTDTQAEQLAAILKVVLIGTLVTSAKGAWESSDAFNKLCPDYAFSPIEEFLFNVWEGKP